MQMPKYGLPEAIAAFTTPVMPCRSSPRMVSPAAPTPGRITAAARATTAGSCVTTKSGVCNATARLTLRKLPAP